MGRYVVARADEIAPGRAKRVTANGRDIALFNVKGEFFAILDRCPHEGASLCRGTIVSLIESDEPGDYRVSRPGEMVRCPWHGWEYDIRTGQSWCDPRKVRVKSYDVSVASGADIVRGPYVAETFVVAVEGQYVVVEA